MKVVILGAGFYGLHIGWALRLAGFDVEVHEITDQIMGGASGKIPARLHQGFHYPRSRMTRAACLEHHDDFMAVYGQFTRGVPVNLYAIAKDISWVDFDQYVRTLRGEVEFISVHDIAEFGLENVEGALLTGERHIVTDLAREFFQARLGDVIRLNSQPEIDPDVWHIDCTFAANSASNVSRYEPCLVPLLKGRSDFALTIMDCPEGVSVYPWDEARSLCSLSSAKWTPFAKDIKTYAHAKAMLDSLTVGEVEERGRHMIESMAHFYPAIRDYEVVDHMLSIRAMPLSGADTRLVDVRREGKMIRVRAGKIDAILAAERMVKEIIG